MQFGQVSRGFWRASLHAAWVQYRALRMHPGNLLLAVFEQAAPLAVWYFVGRFFGAAAHRAVLAYGGSYVAYLMVGMALGQMSAAALRAPFDAISEAFWDKRLEAYRGTAHGIWAAIAGRLLFQAGLAALADGAFLGALWATGLLPLSASGNLLGLALSLALLLAAAGGLGAAGASFFFLLEVKSGQDPVSWIYGYLVMVASGLYVPVAVLPGWLRAVGHALPLTWALSAARASLLSPVFAQSRLLGPALAGLGLGAAAATLLGWPLLAFALRHAERRAGVGSIV